MKLSSRFALALASLLVAVPALAQNAAADRKAAQALKKCVNNVRSRLDAIEKTYHPKLAQKGPAGVKAWFARKDLEVARWYLHQQDGWQGLEHAACEASTRGTPEFQELEGRLKKAEALVEELEKAKGVTFKGVRDTNDIVYVEVATGKDVPRSAVY